MGREDCVLDAKEGQVGGSIFRGEGKGGQLDASAGEVQAERGRQQLFPGPLRRGSREVHSLGRVADRILVIGTCVVRNSVGVASAPHLTCFGGPADRAGVQYF